MMGADEVMGLARDFEAASREVAREVFNVYRDAGEEMADGWSANATATAGAHGKHYPGTITSEMKVGLDVTLHVGPESAQKQGGMGPGFEFGSVNQPAHLDGAKEIFPTERKILQRTDAAIGFLAP